GVVGERGLVLVLACVGTRALLQRGDVLGVGLERLGRLGDLAVGLGVGLGRSRSGGRRGCGRLRGRCAGRRGRSLRARRRRSAGLAQRTPVLGGERRRGSVGGLRAHQGNALRRHGVGAQNLDLRNGGG